MDQPSIYHKSSPRLNFGAFDKHEIAGVLREYHATLGRIRQSAEHMRQSVEHIHHKYSPRLDFRAPAIPPR